VEDALRWCLCGFFTPVADEAEIFDNEGAPLWSFHAKIVMGYALGIYGEVTREDLCRIKLIRNAFAHSPRAITFETPEVKEKCLALSYVDMSRIQTAVTLRPYSDPRGKFLDTARLLLIDLHAIGSRKSECEEVVGGLPWSPAAPTRPSPLMLPSERQKSTPLSRSKPSARRSEMGHEDQFPPRRLSGRSHGHVRSQGPGLGVHGEFSGRCFGSKV
jgi:hypothetical protein